MVVEGDAFGCAAPDEIAFQIADAACHLQEPVRRRGLQASVDVQRVEVPDVEVCGVQGTGGRDLRGACKVCSIANVADQEAVSARYIQSAV